MNDMETCGGSMWRLMTTTPNGQVADLSGSKNHTKSAPFHSKHSSHGIVLVLLTQMMTSVLLILPFGHGEAFVKVLRLIAYHHMNFFPP